MRLREPILHSAVHSYTTANPSVPAIFGWKNYGDQSSLVVWHPTRQLRGCRRGMQLLRWDAVARGKKLNPNWDETWSLIGCASACLAWFSLTWHLPWLAVYILLSTVIHVITRLCPTTLTELDGLSWEDAIREWSHCLWLLPVLTACCSAIGQISAYNTAVHTGYKLNCTWLDLPL